MARKLNLLNATPRLLLTAFTAVGIGLSFSVIASEPTAERPQRHGAETYRWMELQKSGHAAHGAPRGIPGEVAEKVWTRYVNSFEYPIPEEFTRDRFIQGGGG
jgi:hypothetical protein